MTRYATKLKPSPKHKPNLLPLWLALIGLGMLLLAGWAALRGSSPAKTGIEVTGAPRLRIQADTIDRGNVKLGTFVRDDIRVTNVGDQPLRFTQEPYVTLQEGCWPPTPAVGSMVIQPGQSTVVSVEYSMHGQMGGPHDFRLQLMTNDPTQPVKEVKILSNWVD